MAVFGLLCANVFAFLLNGSQWGITKRQSSSQFLNSAMDTHEVRSSKQILVVIDSNNEPSLFKTKPAQQDVSWREVFDHLSEKMAWEAPNERFDNSQGELGIEVMSLDDALRSQSNSHPLIPIVMLVGLRNSSPARLEATRRLTADRTTVVALDCIKEYESLQIFGKTFAPALGVAHRPPNAFIEWIQGLLDGGDMKENRQIYDYITEVWARRSSDDIKFLMLVLINAYYPPYRGLLTSVVAATSSDKTGLKEVSCMCTKCTKQMLDCINDPTCKKALDCLNGCKSNDQVCSYRCITSYETDKFEAFAQCILQRNNCMGNTATIPMTPDPAPLATFRGQQLSFEMAEGIFEGWLAPREGEMNALLSSTPVSELSDASWMVVVGVNPAYDYFSDQHQIFYREKSRPKIMWYDPVFKVETIEGVEVWRRRHYRVRRAKNPGQFRFTVLDNGVLSDEYWRILDADDGLEWAVFYYSGAAAAAGTSYTGALIVTKTGQWPAGMEDPDSENHQRISKALLKGGIRLWEVYEVKNTLSQAGFNKAGPPPLGIL